MSAATRLMLAEDDAFSLSTNTPADHARAHSRLSYEAEEIVFDLRAPGAISAFAGDSILDLQILAGDGTTLVAAVGVERLGASTLLKTAADVAGWNFTSLYRGEVVGNGESADGTLAGSGET